MVDFAHKISDCGIYLTNLTEALDNGEIADEDIPAIISLTLLPLLAFNTSDKLFSRILREKVMPTVDKNLGIESPVGAGIPLSPSQDKS